MIKLSLKRKAILAVAVALVALTALSVVVFASPEATDAEEGTERQVFVKAQGLALSNVDNQTIKAPVNMTLVLYLGERHGPVIPIEAAEGTVNINGTQYNVLSGKGLILPRGQIAFLVCEGEGEDGEITFKLLAEYFWMGGRLYAVRSKGICIIDDTKMVLLLRAMARVS